MSASGPVSEVILLDSTPPTTAPRSVDVSRDVIIEDMSMARVRTRRHAARPQCQERNCPRARPVHDGLEEVEIVGEKVSSEANRPRARKRTRFQSDSPEIIAEYSVGSENSAPCEPVGPSEGEEQQTRAANRGRHRDRRTPSVEIVTLEEPIATAGAQNTSGPPQNTLSRPEQPTGDSYFSLPQPAHPSASEDEAFARALAEADARTHQSRNALLREEHRRRRRTPPTPSLHPRRRRSAIRRREMPPISSAPWMNPGPTSLFETLGEGWNQRRLASSMFDANAVLGRLTDSFRDFEGSGETDSNYSAPPDGAGVGMDYESLLRLDESINNRGLNSRIITALPVSVATTANTNEECCVCLCEYEVGDKMTTLPCFHQFHSDCIGKWLKTNGVCPIDKAPVKQSLR